MTEVERVGRNKFISKLLGLPIWLTMLQGQVQRTVAPELLTENDFQVHGEMRL